MGDASVSTTKIVRRKVMSVANGDFEPSLNRYQVYRGLSPETSNRLEIKIQGLEDELQAERQARLAAQQQCTYLTEELQLQGDHYEGLEGKISSHMDIMKAKDQELVRLRQDFEGLMERSEGMEAGLRKKHQEVVNELNEQIDQLTKQRNRSDADKKNLLAELGELSGNLEKAQAAKAHVDAKLENYEIELRRVHMELEEKSRQLQDLSNAKSRLVHDSGELQSRVKQLESSVDGLSRDRQKLLREIDNLKETVQEAEAEKPHLVSTANALQVELNETRANLEDEQQRSQLLFAQVQKLQNDFTNFKNKAEKDLATSNDENEAIRKRYLGRIAELEDGLNLFQKKSGKVEKEHTRLVIEIRDLADELEKNKVGSLELSKRLKQSESVNSEQRFQIDQLSVSLQQAEGSVARLQAELAKLKSSLGERDDKFEALSRELKLANDRTKEYKQEGDEAKLQVQDLLGVKVGLDREIARLNGVVLDLERKFAESRRNLETCAADAKQMKDELSAELRLKEEEINGLKRTNQKLTEEHQHHLFEFDARHKTELSRTKKLLETEILEISASCDSAAKTQAEMARANKALANRVKELENALLNEERVKDDLRSQVNSAERKRAAAQAELDQLLPRLDQAEHGRKMAELSLHELEQRVSELSLGVAAAGNDARRHEAECNALRVALEEATATRRELEERVEKLRMELDGTNEALSMQLDLAQERESIFKQLERDLKEARCALEEVEQNAIREGKKLLCKVQARCKGLEIDLEAEQRKAREAQAECKRLNRLLQELGAAKDGDMRELSEKTSQLESAQASLARLKKQLMEAEEVITVVTSKYRRLQHQLQEVSDQPSQQEATLVIERATVGQLGVHGVGNHGVVHHGVTTPVSARVSVARSYVSSSTLANRL